MEAMLMQPLCLSPMHPTPPPPRLLSTSHPTSRQSRSLCFSTTKWADRLLGDFNLSDNNANGGASSSVPTPLPLSVPAPPSDRLLTLPIDFYKVLGAEAHFLADGIKRAYDARIAKRPQYGFSPDALIGRRRILNLALDTLSNQQTRIDYEDHATVLLDVTWDEIPGVVCLLQEAGDTELVLQTGARLLNEKLPKGFKQDIVLAMALAYVDKSRDAMAQLPPDLLTCCEVLELALNLLQEEGATNLAPDLMEQIDETLEEITPRCVLELLSLPVDEAHGTKRHEGLRGVRNILWSVGPEGMMAIGGGFSRESFMKEAFVRMTSMEQIELYTTTPSNISPELFEVYSVVLAYVAQGVAFRKPDLIRRADTLLSQLQNPNDNDNDNDGPSPSPSPSEFSLERGMCALLMGDLEKCHLWLGLDGHSSPHRDQEVLNFVMDVSSSSYGSGSGSSSSSAEDLLPGLCKLLETWLLQVVFPRSRDTQEELDFKLGDYYDDPVVLQYLESTGRSSTSHLAAVALAAVTVGATVVKSQTLKAFQNVFPGIMKQFDDGSGISKENNNPEETEGLIGKNFDLGIYMKDTTMMLTSAGVAVFVLAALGLRFLAGKRHVYPTGDIGAAAVVENSHTISNDGREEEKGERGIVRMDAKLAESIVRKWQKYKAVAMGQSHEVESLKEVVDGRMLKVWCERGTEMASRGWHWKYELVDVSIEGLTVSLDGRHATVEATIQEAAQLFHGHTAQHNDAYTTAYAARYEMAYTDTASAWKIVDGAILHSQ